MHLSFLRLTDEERRLYIEEAAGRRGVSSVMLEKDFWVSWMLGLLFGSRFADVLVFKGGTSLSKVFRAIDRFSEDVDLSLSPEFLGLSIAELSDASSRTQAAKWMERAEAACGDAVRTQLGPELEQAIVELLGQGPGRWLEFMIDPATNSPVLLFHYPTTQPSGFDYLRRTVKLEFGSLTDQQPTGRHPIRPWIADILGDVFNDWHCDVVALDVQRTFWEKATILHVEYHRPTEKPMPERFSRHYADTAALSAHEVASRAVDQHELRERVINWKSRFFGSGWARYDLAKPGTFRLAPTAEREAALRRDYETMREMYLSEPASFDAVLAVLRQLETRING